MTDLGIFMANHGVRYFNEREMYTRARPPKDLWCNILPTLKVADDLREEFGRCQVLSGYRGHRHNADVGGASDSMHLYFCALDVALETGRPRDWAAFAHQHVLRSYMGIGEYSDWLHIDTRGLAYRRLAAYWRGT